MKGYKFYAEMPDNYKSKSGCKSHAPFTRRYIKGGSHGTPYSSSKQGKGIYLNCVAVCFGREHTCHDGSQECFSSVFDYANSDVNAGSVSLDYLRKRTVRISETLARRLHPRLFERLDMPD